MLDIPCCFNDSSACLRDACGRQKSAGIGTPLLGAETVEAGTGTEIFVAATLVVETEFVGEAAAVKVGDSGGEDLGDGFGETDPCARTRA